jgi:type II secretory pathway component GspD/PulD (secretin)
MKRNHDAKGRTRVRFAAGVFGVALVLILAGPVASGQTAEKPASVPQDSSSGHVDLRPYQSFPLTNLGGSQNDANEIVVATRNLLDPSVKLYLVPNQNTMVMRGTPDQLALAQRIIKELDRPKKAYRLTYTITEMEAGKRVGVQHFSMIVTEGQKTVLKQGSKVPIVTGSYSATGNSAAQTQITYLDVGMNFDASLDECANGAKLRTKVEQLSIAEQVSGVGAQDPVIRQSSLEGTSFLTLGKPLVLGSLDISGSTRHLDVEVEMELVP